MLQIYVSADLKKLYTTLSYQRGLKICVQTLSLSLIGSFHVAQNKLCPPPPPTHAQQREGGYIVFGARALALACVQNLL